MDALENSVFSLLLAGLITVMALTDGSWRCGKKEVPVWWQPLAQAFAGAGLFLALGLTFVDLSRPGHYGKVVVPGFLSTYAGLVAFLYRAQPPISRFRPRRSKSEGRPARPLLLVPLGLLLFVLWCPFYELAPHILDALGRVLWNVLPLRMVADLGLIGWIGDGGGVTCMGMWPRDVAVEALNLFAGVTLLLWLFHRLWAGAADTPSSSSPTPL